MKFHFHLKHYKINIYGYANFNRTNFDSDTPLNHWGSLYFEGDSAAGSALDSVSIKRGYGICCTDGAVLTVTNSRIDTCILGVLAYNSEVTLYHNHITNPLHVGIYNTCSGLYPVAAYNKVIKSSGNSTYQQFAGILLSEPTTALLYGNHTEGFGTGVSIFGGFANFEDAEFTHPNPNNRIINNIYGLSASWGSTILASIDAGGGSYNAIFNNSTDVTATHSAEISANFNYWGGGDITNYMADSTSFFQHTDPLDYDPGEPVQRMTVQGGDEPGKETQQPLKSFEDIRIAASLEKERNINAAINHYKHMIEKDGQVQFALYGLARAYTKHKRGDALMFLQEFSRNNAKHRNKTYRIFAGLALQERAYEEAAAYYDAIAAASNDRNEEAHSRIDKFFAVLLGIKDKEAAGQELA